MGAADLMGDGAAERVAARRIVDLLQERAAAPVAAVHARVELTSLDEPQRWPWLSDWIS